MKQVKAFVHHNRVGDIVHALRADGFERLSLVEVKGLLRALSAREQEFSVELGGQVISEVQMELYCADETVDRAVAIILGIGRTGHADSGWVYVSSVDGAYAIDVAS